MANSNNFPIKYAVLKLKDNGGYYTYYEDIVRGYIVSKCWVVQSSIKYYANGKNEIFHKVIFPYKDLDAFKISLKYNEEYLGQRVIPSYDFNFNPYPTDIVSNLFNTYDEAKIMADELNEEMKRKLILDMGLRFKKTLSELEKEFKEQLNICQLFEKLSLLNTEDMIITDDITLNENQSLNLKKHR